MVDEEMVEEAFPEINEIDDQQVWLSTIEAWCEAVEASQWDTLHEIPRGSSTIKSRFGISGTPENERNELLVPHVRDVTACGTALSDIIKTRLDIEVDDDIVTAGALLHDISKCYEYSSLNEFKKVKEFFPHPIYSLKALIEADVPLHVQHIVVSHSLLDEIDPKTIEAEIVHVADLMSHQAVNWAEGGKLDPRV